MKEKKHIDRIFQEKFKDFEANPPEEMWDRIASNLDKKKKKRPFVIPLWFKIGGVAAVLVIIAAGFLFTRNTNPNNSETPAIVNQNSKDASNSEKEGNKETGSQISNSDEQGARNDNSSEGKTDSWNIASEKNTNSGIAQKGVSSGNENLNKTGNNSQDSGANRNSQSYSEKTALASNDKNADSKKADKNLTEKEKLVDQPEVSDEAASGLIAGIAIEKTKDSVNTQIEQQNALAALDKKEEKSTEELTEKSGSRLSLSTFAAPIFYKNIGSGNELSSQLGNNNSVSDVTVSYGVKVAYSISDKIKIRTGLSKINVSSTIQDISYSPTALASGLDNINPVGDAFMIRSNSPSNSFASESSMNTLVAPLFAPGEINQNFGFIEVPLELEYALINKKFGLNLIGGASTLFLDENRVDLVSGTTNTRLGKANNINSTSFSTNVGVGMDYDLTDKFSLSVEPIFKYQLNTFNNVQNVQPVNFGIYSGLTIKF